MIQTIFEDLSCSQDVAVCHPFDLELVHEFIKVRQKPTLKSLDVKNIHVKLQHKPEGTMRHYMSNKYI